MNRLKVTPEELRDYAQRMETLINNANINLDEATIGINSTVTSFKGTAAEEIRNSYENLKSKYDDFYRLMSNYVAFIRNVAARYEQTESIISQRAKDI